MKVPPGNPRPPRGSRHVTAGLAEKPCDGLALEVGNGSLLPLDEALAGAEGGWSALLEMQREERNLHVAARRQNDRPLDDVLELPQIAGPRVALEEIESLGGEPVHLLVHLGLGLAEKVMRQDRDVLDAFPEGRQRDREGV